MRRLFLSCMVFCVCAGLAGADPGANFRAGGLILGGSGYYKLSLDDQFDLDSAARTLGINPSISTFISNGFAVNIDFDYYAHSSSNEYPRTNNSKEYTVSLGMDYYLPISGGRLPVAVMAVGVDGGFRQYSGDYAILSESTEPDITFKSNYKLGTSATMYLFLTDRIAPYAGTELRMSIYPDDPDTTFDESYSWNYLTFKFGMAFFIPAKDKSLLR